MIFLTLFPSGSTYSQSHGYLEQLKIRQIKQGSAGSAGCKPISKPAVKASVAPPPVKASVAPPPAKAAPQPAKARAPYEPTQEEIQTRAFEIYVSEGCKEGNDLEYWVRAENELRKS